MHNKTVAYYNKHTKEFIERTIGSDMRFCRKKFTNLLAPGSLILDAGCGGGRDSRCFVDQGFRVRAMDASIEMCRAAAEYIGQPVDCMRFDELADVSRYDGIWASASLLHVKKSELPAILRKFHRALKPSGILYASFKYGDQEEERLERFFSDYHLEEVKQIFLQDDLYEWVDGFMTEDERPDYIHKPWVNLLVRAVM